MRGNFRRQIAEKFPQGAIVDCIVQRVEPFGVFVRLAEDPDVHGYIRKGEWDWSRGFLEIIGRVSPGDRITAEVVDHDGGRLTLSRRKAIPDPLLAFKKEHRAGETVVGQVRSVAPEKKGVHVLLPGEVSGFIPGSEIPETASEEGFGLLAHDLVAAEILAYGDDHVRLSIKEHLRRQDREHATSEAASRTGLGFHPSLGPQLQDIYFSLQLREQHPEPTIDPEVRERIRRILIVEDRTDVSESLELLFEHYGFPSKVAHSVDEAMEHLSRESYDLLILDINLPVASGVELIEHLRSHSSPPYIYVLTATAVDEWKGLVARGSDIVTGFFHKPTKAAEILEKLAHRITGEGADEDHRNQLPGFSPQALDKDLLQRTNSMATIRQERVEKLLKQVREKTRANNACVLAYRPGPRFNRAAGDFPDLTLEEQQALDISPIGDVIKGQIPLMAADVSKRKEKFKHLLRVFPLGSFAGYPLAHRDQAEYGLFIFGERAGQLANDALEDLRIAAVQIGQSIAEQRLDAAITENQGLLLTGFLADSLMHEIKNELQTLDDFSDLQILLAKRYPDDLRKMSPPDIVNLKKSILGIQDLNNNLRVLVRLFQNLAGRPPAEIIDLNGVVEHLVATVRPFADKKHVALGVTKDEDLPEIRVSPKLIEQPIMNILINGVEQTALSGRSHRWVQISTEYHPGEERPVRILVEDNGPGIHTINWARIFDLFFTTKERGTGLGLYLGRVFIQELGGQLRLSQSLQFSGTQFTIELPRGVIA